MISRPSLARLCGLSFAPLVIAMGFSAQAPSPAHAETWRVVNIEPTGRVHMRQRPSSRGKILAYIPGDARNLPGKACSGKWCQIEFRGVTGWVFRGFLEADEGETAGALQPGGNAREASPQGGKRNTDALAEKEILPLINRDGRPFPIYAFPNDTLPVAGRLPADTKSVEGLGACIGNWCYVRSGRLIGWLRADAIASEDPPPAAAAPPAEEVEAASAPDPALEKTIPTASSTAIVTAALPDPDPKEERKTYALAGLSNDSGLPIRERPDGAARVVTWIPPDAKNVEGLRKCVEKWCLVRWEDTSGWVARRHLADPEAEGSQIFKVAGLALWSTLKVMDYPDEQASVVGNIPAYATGIVPIGGCDKVWCHVRYLGLAGWVSGRHLEPQRQ